LCKSLFVNYLQSVICQSKICKYVLKHKAFISGDFDTNFIKHYFETPELVNTAMLEEKKALESAVEILWKDLKEKNEREFISKPIHGAWKLMVK